MGFFARKKKDPAGQSVVSDLSTPSGVGVMVVGSNDGDSSDDDYVALENPSAAVDAAEAEAGGGGGGPSSSSSSSGGPSSLELVLKRVGSAISHKSNKSRSATSASSSGKHVETESIEDGYVNATITGKKKGGPKIEEKDVFDGVKGTVQRPKYKDVKYAVFFVMHFAIAIWWFVASFFPSYSHVNNAYYGSANHVGLTAFVSTTAIAGLGLSFMAFGYMLRHGETILKTTVAFSTAMCLGVGLLGLFLGEMFMSACGFIGFASASMYANTVWPRLQFTALNLSTAITAIRDNMGLIIAAFAIAGVAFIWLTVAVIGGVHAHRAFGNWALVYSIFSYYWTHQVFTNIVSVVTAGIIGRWFVIGEETPTFSTGLKEMLTRARTYSLGCICFGSLFFGMVQIFQGLASFLYSKSVPILPRFFDWILLKINDIIDDVNEFAYVYVGLYGYSYTAAAQNVTTLLDNKGWLGVVKYHMASNIMFMANMTIGLLTGFIGLIFAGFEYKVMYRTGLTSPTTDGFFVGFLVGFLMSSIVLSVVTTAINTLTVCLVESPTEFKANHPDLSQKLESAWKKKAKDTRSEL